MADNNLDKENKLNRHLGKIIKSPIIDDATKTEIAAKLEVLTDLDAQASHLQGFAPRRGDNQIRALGDVLSHRRPL